MQLIIKNGKIVATHTNGQDVAGLYPGSECIQWDKPLVMNTLEEGPTPDPRSNQEKENTYKDKRRVTYPSVIEQLDMLYNDTVNETTTWVDAITLVKNTYPKLAKE